MLKNDGSHERKTDGPEKLGKFVYSTPAIRTLYNGIYFRSRLEAKWAAFFDQMGWTWLYEPTELNGWFPDFEVGTVGTLVEVKPFRSLQDFEDEVIPKITAAMMTFWQDRRDVVLLGEDPRFMWTSDHIHQLYGKTPGWHVVFDEVTIGDLNGPDSWRRNGPDVKQVVLTSVNQSWHDRITGMYDGAYSFPGEIGEEGNAKLVADAWKNATNATQWSKSNDAR